MLNIDGAFLAFLTHMVIIKPGKLKELTRYFGWETGLLLAVICLCLAGSIIAAIVFYGRGLRLIIKTSG